ncbi:MAG TPA: VOC family protein [Pseudonocardiaceae bacterium]|nr:VOC family protein [Pseudonocardiaceae bacterium]
MSGEISWVELPAADSAKARAFFGGLFGWRTTEYPGDYHVVDNGLIGAIAPREEGFTHPRVYFATEDADVAVKRVQELGGSAGDVATVPGIGRIAHCQDDQGTPFSLFEPAQQG